jgi:hypothetical protein
MPTETSPLTTPRSGFVQRGFEAGHYLFAGWGSVAMGAILDAVIFQQLVVHIH